MLWLKAMGTYLALKYSPGTSYFCNRYQWDGKLALPRVIFAGQSIIYFRCDLSLYNVKCNNSFPQQYTYFLEPDPVLHNIKL